MKFGKFFSFKRKRLKHLLVLEQADRLIKIKGELARPDVVVTQLLLISRSNEHVIRVDAASPSARFDFSLDLARIAIPENIEDVYDFFIVIRRPKESLTEKQLLKIEPKAEYVKRTDGGFDLEYPIRLGRFERTKHNVLKSMEASGNRLRIYITKKGNLSLAVNQQTTVSVKTQVNRLKLKRNRLLVEGKVFTLHESIEQARLLLKSRDSNNEIILPVNIRQLERDTEQKFGLRRYFFQANVDLNTIVQKFLLDEDIYDAYFEIKWHDREEVERCRIGKPRFRARYFIRAGSANIGDKWYVVTPYYTFKGFNLSFQIDGFDRETFVYLHRMLRWAWFLRLFNKRKNIWIIGERPYKAQDTGFHFFKYMREKHPNHPAYYVIEEHSPERKNVDKYGNVLIYKSKAHIWHTLMATKVIGSHHPDYLYPLRTKAFKKAVKATKVFLQHGVMGTKNMVANYGKNAPGFETDLFLVSSDFEKNMIVQDFGYDPREVAVTGLSRFDGLFADDVAVKKQLLVIPTWRDWILTDEEFLESEYFARWKSFVSDPRLHEMAERHGFDIVFCLHPNMQKFTPYFKDLPIRVISQGEVDVQRLIKESALMVTDYSSVAFDFSFLHKPIIYYQFDRGRFIGKRRSHFDLDNDLPGEIVFDHEDLIQRLNEYAERGFRVKAEYIKRADRLIKHRDRNNCERIYQTILHFKPVTSWFDRMLRDDLVRTLFRRYRKSPLYFPSMKLFYNIARRVLPVDRKLIVFESGVGKQVADSPRAIYEEIVRRQLDYKKVWVCNKNIRFRDPKTKRITRLSPQYYYYLARARYWINNQNFPTYIKKRPQTTYIQTWHGTPLKKMLFDIEKIQGRNEDYLERVYQATKSWDYLISPSPYATKAFKSAFHFEGEILEIGYPRNDIFYKPEREEVARTVRNRLNIDKDKKVILYAPTFRDNQTVKNNKFVFDLQLDLEKMRETLGDDYVVLLRMHVVITNKIKIPEEIKDFVKNVSDYPDIQDLYLIADILITDYSSVMFDFANSRKPMLFYTYDLETYRDDLRGFYMDFEKEAPGPLLKTTDDIITAIQNIQEVEKVYKERYDAFYNKYCGLEDGQAAKRVVDRFFA
ncbi:CDP-glycerol glycerophosphotransferase family protein [Caenibacillus caldisaponilyticus]|uniref:CDP-glycerol glycerophosphotransferase family protein n=1 Tax=Caenibacillus caldisaponilyticus TaxID=1674942 RepID=UPI0009886301|nr:CDP-glycerol glycerophosphotransferase family protein [Caenibacillus caldisaponilyticus]